jgi:poly(A) polymerase Pap1
VDGIKATLRYCAAASVVDDWPTAMRRPPSDVLFSSMNRESLAALQSVRDMYSMLRSIPDLGQFRIAHIFIREWAQARGVFSSHHGYLCGTSLSVMLTAVSKHLALQLDALDGASGDTFAACQLVAAFFHDYADFDFASKVVCDPYYYPDMPASRQTRGDGMTIMGWHLPFRNIATMSTKHSANVLSQELERARSALKDVSLNWSSLQGQPHQSASRFISHFQTFIKIDVSYWGSSAERGRLFSSWVGSRSASLPIGE